MIAFSPRMANRDLNIDEFQKRETRLKSFPQLIVVELTQGCNLACPMCRSKLVPVKMKRMSDELFEKIATELFPTAWMVDLRGCGESLILPEICERIKGAAKYGTAIRFVTNLAFCRNTVIDLLAAMDCHVGVSVDAATPQLFRLLRGGADITRIVLNLRRLVAACLQLRGDAENLHITTTLQRPALDELEAIIDLAADVGVPEVRFFSVTAPLDSWLSTEGYEKHVDYAVTKAAQRAAARGIRLYAGTRLGSMPENNGDRHPCLHPWSYAYFAWDGSIGFCDHLIGPDCGSYILGNMTKQGFTDVWNGSPWVELRKEHINMRRMNSPHFLECAWCYRHRYIDFEHVFNPQFLSSRVMLSKATPMLDMKSIDE